MRYKLTTLLALVGLAFCACSPATEDPSRLVRLYADSTSGSVLGNYLCGGTFSVFVQASPWSIEIQTERGDHVILTAGSYSGSGTVTARIFVDGDLFREGTGSLIVQVSGTLE